MMRGPVRNTLVFLLVLAAVGSRLDASMAQNFEPEETALACVMEPKSVIKLGSAEEGIIREILVDRGAVVKRGDIVARLDSELEEVQAELANVRAKNDVEVQSSRTRLKYRRTEESRAAELHTKKIVATKFLDEAEVERRLAEMSLRAAELDQRTARLEYRQAQARLERRNLRSPIDGIVVERNMSAGEYAHEQSPVMTIAEIDPLNVEVFVPVSMYGTVAEGMPAEVRPAAPIGGLHRARVTVVDRIFDTASGTFGVRLELPNPDRGLPAGLKCTVRFLPMEVAWEPQRPPEIEAVAESLPAEEDEDVSATTKAEAVGGAESVPQTVGGDGSSGQPVPQRLVRRIQQALQEVGFEPGVADGYLGPKTRTAIESFQRSEGLPVDGEASQSLLNALQSSAPEELTPAESVPPEAATASGEASPSMPIEEDKPGETEPNAAVAEAVVDKAVPPGGTSAEMSSSEPGNEPEPAAGAGDWYQTFRKASAALRAKDTDQALALYSQAIDSGALPPEYEAMARNVRGSLRSLRGLDAEAIADFGRAIELKPDYTVAYINRGLARLRLERYPEAIADYDRAIALDPDSIEAYHGRAVAFARQGDHRRAIADYDRVNKLDPSFATAYFNRAIAYENLGDQARATEDYAALYRLQPDYPGLKARMAQLGIQQ